MLRLKRARTNRDLHPSLRRQRPMCIRGRPQTSPRPATAPPQASHRPAADLSQTSHRQATASHRPTTYMCLLEVGGGRLAHPARRLFRFVCACVHAGQELLISCQKNVDFNYHSKTIADQLLAGPPLTRHGPVIGNL